MSESLNLEVVLFRALDKVLQVTGIEASEIYLQAEQTREMVRKVHSGLFPKGFHDKTRFQPGEGLVGAVAAGGESVLVDDISQDRWLLRDKVKESQIRSLIGVPLKTKGTIVGVMMLATVGHNLLKDADLLVGIGNPVTIQRSKT